MKREKNIRRINKRINQITNNIYSSYKLKKYKWKQLENKSRTDLYYLISIQQGQLKGQKKTITKQRGDIRQLLRELRVLIK